MNHDTCARAECPLETVALRALKDEESGRIRADESLFTLYDSLVTVYAKLAVRVDAIEKAIDALEEEAESRHAEVLAELKKNRSFKYVVSVIIAGAAFGGQLLSAVLQ